MTGLVLHFNRRTQPATQSWRERLNITNEWRPSTLLRLESQLLRTHLEGWGLGQVSNDTFRAWLKQLEPKHWLAWSGSGRLYLFAEGERPQHLGIWRIARHKWGVKSWPVAGFVR